jgi:hypothetical protein
MKQTAVEWLEEIIYGDKEFSLSEVFEQAKEMEKQQIIESYCQGCFDITQDEYIFPRETSEDYYNETHNNTNK